MSTPRENILVCKKYFVNTFNISTGRIDRILKAKDIPKDMRGRMYGSCRRTSELAIKFVRGHIKSFPAFESHYTRSQNPERKYLNPELNINKMFNLYLENVRKLMKLQLMNGHTGKSLKEILSYIFINHAKTRCERCDLFNMKIQTTNSDEEKATLVQRHDVHLKNAELARKAL